MARNPVTFSNGTLVQKAQVEVDGTTYEVEPAQFSGTTPLSASNLNLLQTRLYDYIDNEITDLNTVRSQTITVTGTRGNATVNFMRVGKVVQLTATMTASSSNATTYILSFIEEQMPSWAKVSESSEIRTLINIGKVGSVSDMSSYINIQNASTLEFFKGNTNRYSLRFYIFKSSDYGELTQTLTGCYITDID